MERAHVEMVGSLSEIKYEHSARNAPISPALVCRSITAMGSALPVLVQSGNLSLEIWSSGGWRLKNSATIKAAFELIPTGKGETEESILACASGRRPSARQRFRQGRHRTHPRDAGASRHRGRHD